jgi:serine phosphatase RsbU (regulator of sigma subunit)/PAS domain-containing protein
MSKRLSHTLSRIAEIGAGVERNDRVGALAAVTMLAALVALDALLGTDVVLAGAFLVVPFIAALVSGVLVTAAMAVLALVAGVSSGAWNMNFGTADFDARLGVLAIGGLFAVAGSWARERGRRGARRLELLDEVGAVADGSLPLAETLERVVEVIVPGFADFCMVDAIHEQRVMRSAVRAAGDDSAFEVERRLLEREPSVPEWMVRPGAPFPRHPRFIPRFTEEDARRLAHDQQDLRWLRSVGVRSSISVAMVARDRMLGALTVNTAWSGHRYTLDDVRFAQALASRVALALDNAGLFSDLESVERRMDNVMSILDEAIVIYDAQGELVFANPAAARMMGLAEGEDPTATAAASIRERFVTRAEDGTRLGPDALLGPKALRGEPVEPLVLRVAGMDGESERWLIARSKPILGPDGRALYSVTAIEDVTEVKRAEHAQRLLAGVGDVVASMTDSQGMLREVAGLMVPEFADCCTVNLPSADGTIEQAAVAAEPGLRDRLIALRREYPIRLDDAGGIAHVMRSGEAELLGLPEGTIEGEPVGGNHRERMESMGLSSGLLVPMTSGQRTIGVLAFGILEGTGRFHEGDLRLAVEIGRRAGSAIDHARLAEERSEVARVLQEGLMPRALPHMPGWETAAVYQPAGEVNAVGGDFYDAFETEEGWMVLVGDVVGRGAAAASLTALARHTIRTAGTLTGDPCRALALLDDALRARGEAALCTMAIMLLPRSADAGVEVKLVSAGHPLPLRLRDGTVEEVGRPGPLLGAFEESSWELSATEIREGDQLVVFTDGVIEAGASTERFGEERLHAELRGADRPVTAIARITGALEAFLSGGPADDVAIVAVRRSETRVLAVAEPGLPARGGRKTPHRVNVPAVGGYPEDGWVGM